MQPIPLGPYDLQEPLGRGGMGRVWGGLHRHSGVQVAVKVLDPQHDEPRYHVSFRNEARAMAGLTHPHVVWVLDYGVVEAAAAEGSDGQVPAGQPYLVMEKAEQGTLAAWRGRRISFRRLRRLLLAVLDALSHAHARGVVHRDLKPSNVLLGGLRPGPKLADFGLAHIETRAHSDGAVGSKGGTPGYMAPEQFRDAWRDQGPWTDLYALGVLGWRLATGSRPFRAKGWRQLMRAHLAEPPPDFLPLAPVPEGFEAWLRTCLAKDPGNRFQRAADAAWALDQLDEPRSGELDRQFQATDATGLQRTTLVWPERTASTVRERFVEADSATARSQALRRALPPVPGRWRRGDSEPPPLPLVGTGLRLFGLREVPMVAREAERDALWRVVRQVGRRGGVRAVVLRGASGSGKSRLARWLCERAHEVGTATLLEAGHSPMPGPLDGVGPMLARHLRCDGLERDEGLARIRSLQSADAEALDAVALAELIWPTTLDERAAGAEAVHFTSAADRHRVVERTLRTLERPAAVWLDDVQWGLDALELCTFLLERQRCAAALVLTLREEALADRPAAAALLEALCRREDVATVHVGPLAPEERRDLVRHLLPLSEPLALALEDRSAGSPLYAVQCIAHWVASDALELGDDGFRLAGGATFTLPADLADVWSTRLERVLDGHPESAGHVLELAAALGQQVDGPEWRNAAARSGWPIAGALIEQLLLERLAVPGRSATGFAFAHGMLREALERRARDAGRWEAVNATCADVLAATSAPGVAERVGRHRLEAGQLELALQPLIDAFDERLARDDLRRCEGLLEDWQRAWDALDREPSDPRSVEGRIRRAGLRLIQLRREEGDRLLTELRADLARFGWPRMPPRLALLTAALHKSRSELDDAIHWYCRAEALYTEAGDRQGVGRACKNLAECHVLQGRSSEGEAAALRGLQALEGTGDDYASSIVCHVLAVATQRLGKAEEARTWVDRCVVHARRAGNPIVEGQAVVTRAGLLEQDGALDAAEELLQHALALFGEERTVVRLTARTCLAHIALRRGQFVGAREQMTTILEDVRGRWGVLEALLHAGLSACAAGLLDGPALDREWPRATELLASSGYVDPDVVFVTEVLAEHARPWRPDVADQAAAIARQQRAALGMPQAS